jgi:hypothetical protein
MSEPVNNKEKIYTVEDNKLIPLRTFLIAYSREKNLKPQDFAGLVAYAGNRTMATKEEWEKLYAAY